MMLDNRAVVSVLLEDSLIVFYRTLLRTHSPCFQREMLQFFVCPNHSLSALGLSGE